MFGRLKQKNSCEQDALAVYKTLLERVREPVFYTDLGVPDTFEGRFDLLILHAFMVMHVTLDVERGGGFNQALFDALFANMDQALRQGGKGDMGVPKHMRRMMKLFNGCVNSYNESLGDDVAFEDALRRNLYAGDCEATTLQRMRNYVQGNIQSFRVQGALSIIGGQIKLEEIAE